MSKVLQVSPEIHKLVKKKQLELSNKRNEVLPLVKVSDEIILKGLEAMVREDNPIEPVILVEGKPYNSKSETQFELGK